MRICEAFRVQTHPTAKEDYSVSAVASLVELSRAPDTVLRVRYDRKIAPRVAFLPEGVILRLLYCWIDTSFVTPVEVQSDEVLLQSLTYGEYMLLGRAT